ncbi:MAG: hypothetical protein KGL39_54105 [Patescibacteria group bacterium]|nr:hypothetical protein [Patescibacteria group bacterium]
MVLGIAIVLIVAAIAAFFAAVRIEGIEAPQPTWLSRALGQGSVAMGTAGLLLLVASIWWH